MKYAYPCLIAAGVAAGVFAAFSGCGSSSNVKVDAGGCQPACVDALEEPLGDVHFADMGAPDAGVNCSTVCAKLTKFEDGACPDPGCVTACLRQQQGCSQPTAIAAVQALLDCEMSATYTCSTAKPPLPVTTDCNGLADAAAKACAIEAGADAGCSTTVTADECKSCCTGMNPSGAMTYGVALTDCACDTPGYCNIACVDSFCMAMTPLAGSPCSKCLAAQTGPDGGCAMSVNSACIADKSCVAYEGCLKKYGCATKK